ncbi:putative phage tail protein [Paenibacillus flagellatus]|uniref:Phage portal protein n=1 Tax=Paenibacillus flagellatus TaxID=2211139 RepID=A0A2V5K033_9BACL|nr:putative phage tail protein [Paenibacillus flagellatus]PYI52555.1 phage portal protein [Paenibacillus flagellatus]
MNAPKLTSFRGQKMASYVPRYYETSRVFQSLLQTEGQEVDDLRAALDSIVKQFFVRVSTWGLDAWEQELGLSPTPNQPENERKDRIVSRLRGVGTATIRVLKEVAEAYHNGTIDVIEDCDNFNVIVRFVDTSGIPATLNDIHAAVRNVLPAHLNFQFEFKYFLWSDLDAMAWTWDQFDDLNLTWDQLEVYV